MKPHTDGNIRPYVCKRRGKEIAEDIAIWKRKLPEWKKVCLNCLPDKKRCIRRKRVKSIWYHDMIIEPDDRNTLSYE